ncbi:MAG: hypothetical protein RL557_449 [archaeon]
MQTINTWDEFDAKTQDVINAPRVEGFSHHIYLRAVAHPGVIPWAHRDKKISQLYDTAHSLEAVVKKNFSGLDFIALESPKTSNPKKEVEIYAATMTVKKNNVLCVGISLDLSYNENHERKSGSLQRFPEVPYNLNALLPLNGFQQNTKDMIQKMWNLIDSFHFCTCQGESYDSTFLIEVNEGDPVSGGKFLLKKLGLSLPEKKIYVPQ